MVDVGGAWARAQESSRRSHARAAAGPAACGTNSGRTIYRGAFSWWVQKRGRCCIRVCGASGLPARGLRSARAAVDLSGGGGGGGGGDSVLGEPGSGLWVARKGGCCRGSNLERVRSVAVRANALPKASAASAMAEAAGPAPGALLRYAAVIVVGVAGYYRFVG